MRNEVTSEGDLPVRIADSIRDSIVTGQLVVDERLPSEADLAQTFGVSRPTIREALKRLAAQNLIRTQRGAAGGAFVNRVSFDEVQSGLVTHSILLLSMNAVDLETACEARFGLERACIPLAVERCSLGDIGALRAEIARQGETGLSDPAFCASDVAFHKVLVEAAGNPILSLHVTGAIEAMQPLMNMITFRDRSRQRIIALHVRIVDAVEAHLATEAEAALAELAAYTVQLGIEARDRRAQRLPTKAELAREEDDGMAGRRNRA
ncbi:MAG: FadR family transcriptional regulator [Tabrizicola sp.]|nr:FadR family transcriptional regulator [Tabrizicola sp.]